MICGRAIVILAALSLAGCANLCDPGGRTRNGAIVGASTGAAAGYVIASGGGALVVAAAQGYLGYTLGAYGESIGPDQRCVAAQEAAAKAAEEAARQKALEAQAVAMEAQTVDLATLLADPNLPGAGTGAAPIVLEDPSAVAPLTPEAAGLDGDLPALVALTPAGVVATAAAADPLAVSYAPDADGRVRLVLPADVLFDQNSSYFSVATLPRLREIFKEIAKRAPRVVIIVGHSDNTGSEDYNVWLSNRRAQRVAEMLRQETAEAFEVQADGRGAVEPRAANDTDEGRAQNRRVEIQFEPTAR